MFHSYWQCCHHSPEKHLPLTCAAMIVQFHFYLAVCQRCHFHHRYRHCCCSHPPRLRHCSLPWLWNTAMERDKTKSFVSFGCPLVVVVVVVVVIFSFWIFSSSFWCELDAPNVGERTHSLNLFVFRAPTMAKRIRVRVVEIIARRNHGCCVWNLCYE